MKGRLLSGDPQDQGVEGGRELGGGLPWDLAPHDTHPQLSEGWEAGIGPLNWENPRVWAQRERGAMLKKRRDGKPGTLLLYKPH